MQLYTFWRSSAAYRVRIALAHKGLAPRLVHTSLRTGEHRRPDFRAVNPQGLVPVLEDGDVRLTQSIAMIEYLEETRPDPPLLPADAADRAQVRAMAQLVACDIHPLNNLRVLDYLKSTLGQDEAAVVTWYRYWVAEGFGALEALAARWSGDGLHLFASTVSLADVCLVPQMYNARRYSCDLSAYPALTRISAHLESLPAFAAARPEVQADAEGR
jgi:maleylacetoacetate isomerase